MKQLPNAELNVMMAIWQMDGAVTRAAVHEMLSAKAWAQTTVAELLSRLVKRGFLGAERRGQTNYYTPLITQGEYQALESSTLLKKLFHDSPKALLASLYRDKPITEAEYRELLDVLEEMKGREER